MNYQRLLNVINKKITFYIHVLYLIIKKIFIKKYL